MKLFQVLVGFEIGHPTDGVDAGGNGPHNLVSWCNGRIRDPFVLKLYCVAEAVTICCFDMTFVCAIVFWRCADIPTVHGMKRPCATGVGFFMNLYIAPHGCQWHFVIVKRSIHVCIGGDGWCGIGLLQ